jgi:hypothetical protein
MALAGKTQMYGDGVQSEEFKNIIGNVRGG